LAEKVFRFRCTRRLAGGDDEHAVTQLERPRRGHPLAGVQTAIDDDVIPRAWRPLST
jgi:hypothetical protein